MCIFICYLTIEGHGVGVEECYWKRSTMKKKYWETMLKLKRRLGPENQVNVQVNVSPILGGVTKEEN